MIPITEPTASERDKANKGSFQAGKRNMGRVMNKLFRTVSAVVLAAVIAGAFTILPSFSNRVDASAPITLAIAAAPVPVVTGRCAEQHWPYIDADCLRDPRKVGGEAQPASRVVKIDRKMAAR